MEDENIEGKCLYGVERKGINRSLFCWLHCGGICNDIKLDKKYKIGRAHV